MALTRKQLAAIHAKRNKELEQVRKISVERGVDHGEARKILAQQENTKLKKDLEKIQLAIVRQVSAERGVDHAEARRILEREGQVAMMNFQQQQQEKERKAKPTLNQKKAIFALTMQATKDIQKAKQQANKPKTRDEASEMIQGLSAINTLRSS